MPLQVTPPMIKIKDTDSFVVKILKHKYQESEYRIKTLESLQLTTIARIAGHEREIEEIKKDKVKHEKTQLKEEENLIDIIEAIKKLQDEEEN